MIPFPPLASGGDAVQFLMMRASKENVVDRLGYTLILSSWLRLPADDVGRVLAASAKAGLLPRAAAQLCPGHAAAGLVAVMLAATQGGAGGVGAAAAEACGMSLEGEAGTDPLDGMARGAFCRLVGASLGTVSANGYLNFAEALGAALSRHRINVGEVELDGVGLQMHGTDPVGYIRVVAGGAAHEFRFTPGGVPTEAAGLRREVSVGRAALAGIAFVLDADRERGGR